MLAYIPAPWILWGMLFYFAPDFVAFNIRDLFLWERPDGAHHNHPPSLQHGRS